MTPATPAKTLPSTRLFRRELSSVIGGRSVLRAPNGDPEAAVVHGELLTAVRAIERRVWRKRQVIGQELGGEPVPVRTQTIDQAGIACHHHRDPTADLIAGR